MIEDHVIREILSSVDIAQLVGEYVQLKRMGRNIKGLCPFHAEKTPSFSVSPDKGMFYCFGCGVGGSSLDFIMKIEGLNFVEAVERLGARVGIEVKQVEGKRDNSRRSRRLEQLEVMSEAADFFTGELATAQGAAARFYAEQRGITEEMLKAFSLGYASNVWEAMPNQLKLRQQNLNTAFDLGLIGKKEGGGYFGRFRDRLMFPVRDEQGRVIAFSGRALDGQASAKYINSPESELYTKGQHLFGLYEAKEHIRREKTAILVEGNLDVVLMHAHGFRHTIASLGTALTSEQAKLLSRFCDRVIVIYDADQAGRKATMRALSILLAFPVEARVVSLPEGEDPDSFLRLFGRESMEALINSAEPLSMWCVKRQCESILAAPLEQRKHSLGELKQLLALFTDDMAKRHFLEESARILSMDPRRLAEELSISYSTAGGSAKSATRTSNASSYSHDPIEWALLRILLEYPEKRKEFIDSDGTELLEDERISLLLKTLASLPDDMNASEANTKLQNEQLRALFHESLCSELSVSEELAEDWFRGAVASLTQRWVGKQIVSVGNALQLAMSQANQAETESLLERYQALQKLKREAQVDRKLNWKAYDRESQGL